MRPDSRQKELFTAQLAAQHRLVSRTFVWLMLAQWAGAMGAAWMITPYTWIGATHRVHQHVVFAVMFGGILTAAPVWLGLRKPSATLTRHVIAVCQMLYSALLIHLTGGRIETHFHIFGSLAFLAFYRDWRVLATATVVLTGDHFLRGGLFPLSVFGTTDAGNWRWLEHAGWVAFEDIVLFASCTQSVREMGRLAAEQAALEHSRDTIEGKVQERTTELTRVAEALIASEVELRAAKEQAESASRSKSDFLANMSHEIRTPMTAILGFADALMDPVQTPEHHIDCVTTIRRNGEHLLTLINDILDLSKIEAGKFVVESIDCSPARVAEEACRLMQVKADAKGLRLDVEVVGAPLLVRSDPFRLRQVLVNLVGNAIKFTEHGGITVRVCVSPDAARPEECTVCIEVRDTGIGMTAEQVSRLFGAFSQADASTTRRFGGTGLGLMISKRLAVLLGGTIVVTSEPGRGSTFAIVLQCPRARDGAQLTGLPRGQPGAISAENVGLHGRILLAEDGPDNQRLISFVLRRAGADVEVAENGCRAVDMAVASLGGGRPYDLILMDMQMPEMDGYAATQALRARGWRGPIVALTAHAMSEDRQRCIDAGCDDYLTKPIDRPALLACCRAFMVESRTERSKAA